MKSWASHSMQFQRGPILRTDATPPPSKEEFNQFMDYMKGKGNDTTKQPQDPKWWMKDA